VPTRRQATMTAPPSAGDRLRAALAAEDLARAIDAAIELGPTARDQIPEPLRAAFDAVLDAFHLYETGHDDAAREKLQAIGLSSPLLDWKLLLRGLMAFAAGDDARALDNWSRLASDRVAFGLVAPLRFAIDPSFRTVNSPAAQSTLQRHGDRLVGGAVPGLRALQGLLARGRLADAFRQAEMLLPELTRGLPHAVDRLGDCFRAAIISHGEPADVAIFRRVFGAPADDPSLARLEALAAEDRRAWAAAHKLWQQFEQSVIDNPVWPAADRNHARALVWCRMGRNAADAVAAGRRLQPNAEACFKTAADLAPDLLEPHEQLFELLSERGKPAPAIAAGKRLLAKFPDHGPTLDALAELCCDKGDSAAALDFAARALAVNPLDRRLRDRLAEAHEGRARSHASAGRLSAAAVDLDAALKLCDGRPDIGLLVHSAAIAFKAGDTEAAERQARQASSMSAAAAAYGLAAEGARLKLPRPLKQRFDAELTAALDVPPTGPAAVRVVTVFCDQVQRGAYLGLKAHEKKVQAFAEAAVACDFGEIDLVSLCDQLCEIGWWRLVKKAVTRGQKRFPRNPFFPFFEAVVHMTADSPLTWKVEPLIEKSRRLAENYPLDDELRQLLCDLDDIQRQLAVSAPAIHMLNELFDMFNQ
jgi:tetratricopeptide (TPR) repeat protein